MSMLGRMFGFGRNVNYDHGLRFFDQGLFEQAIEALNKVIKEDDGSDPLSRRLALFYIAESNSSLGIAALQKQAYAHAKEHLEKALELNPHYADLRLHYGRACQKLGENTAARDAYAQALAINPKFAKARFYFGLTSYELLDLDKGFAEITAAVSAEPAFRTSILDEAIEKHLARDYSGAAALFEKVAETDVDDISYHVRLGTDLYRRGMYDQAIEELGKALALNANYADIHNHLAIAYNAKGDHTNAIKEFREALRINPNYVEARTNLGLTLKAAGMDNDADNEFDQVLALDAENVVAKEQRRQ